MGDNYTTVNKRIKNNDEGHNNEQGHDTNRILQHWKHRMKCWVTFFIRLQPEKPGNILKKIVKIYLN